MLKLSIPQMKLNSKMSGNIFILTQFLILISALAFLAGLFYVLNIQYKKPSTPFSNGPVTTKPSSFTLDLSQPSDQTLSFNSSILVSGRTLPKIHVLISTETSDDVVQSKADGTFSYTLDLIEGVNSLEVTAFDPSGDFRSVSRTIYYSKEKIE